MVMLQFCKDDSYRSRINRENSLYLPSFGTYIVHTISFNVYCQATFNQLINYLQIAENMTTIMINNNFRPAGTKRVPKVNYGKNGRKRTTLPTNDSSL
jgi:hypothetical protein